MSGGALRGLHRPFVAHALHTWPVHAHATIPFWHPSPKPSVWSRAKVHAVTHVPLRHTFSHSRHLGVLHLQAAIACVTIVPVRILGLLLLLCIGLVVGAVITGGCKHHQSNAAVCLSCRWLWMIGARCILFLLGFWWISVTGSRDVRRLGDILHPFGEIMRDVSPGCCRTACAASFPTTAVLWMQLYTCG